MTTGYHNMSPGMRSLAGGVKPPWTIDLDDEVSFLEWFKEFVEAIEDEHKMRTERDLIRRDFYMGLQSQALGREGIPRDKEGKPLQKFARVTINQCYEIVEQWVSKMTRYAPAIAVIPPNDEYNDRMAAQLSKDFIDYLFYVNDIDEILEECARTCRIDGEVYCLVTWSKSKGDYSRSFKEAQDLGIRIPLVDSEGEPILNEKHEQLYIDKASRVGDVDFEVVQRKHILLPPEIKWKDVDYFIRVSAVDIDELKAQYPDKAFDIEAGSSSAATSNLFESDFEYNEVLVYELYHRSTEFLQKGRYIKFTENTVLENGPLPYSHGELPVARLTNIDVPGLLYGQSILDQIMLLNVMYNNLASIAYTNMALGAHVYWMVPTQSNVDIQKLRNGASVIRYNGGAAPALVQFKTVGEETFKTLQFVNEAIQRTSAIHGVSRGEPPAGIEAGIALAFLEEQENQRANTDIKKHNSFIKKLARHAIAVAGDYYTAEDGRTIRIVGKNNQFAIKALDVAKLGGPYDIRVQRTTALSESKAGRISQLLAIQSRFPGLVPQEQAADMLELANEQKYYNLTTVAVQAAERENERMMEGQQVPSPDEWEEHKTHWYTHFKHMQSASFKEDTPQKIKETFKLHLATHEMWMFEKAKVNPAFGQKLLSLDGFPAVSDPLPVSPPSPTSGPAGVPPGASGEPNLPGEPEETMPEPTDGGAPEAVPPDIGPVPPGEGPPTPDQMPIEQR